MLHTVVYIHKGAKNKEPGVGFQDLYTPEITIYIFERLFRHDHL